MRNTAATTICDVARESGFSVATVSNVLSNGPRPVRAETRQHVLSAARRLNYHPNAMAQGLVRRRMNTLGILFGVTDSVEAITKPYAFSVLQGVLTAAAKAGYNITHFTQPWRNAEQSAPAVRDRRTDGVILVAPTSDSDMLSGLAALGIPLVTVSAPPVEQTIMTVDVDNAAGGRLATEHLLALGHTRIAHLTGNENLVSVHQRREAFRAAMDAAQAPVRPEFVVPSTYDGLAACAQTRQLLSGPEPPTAIFAGNDEIALSVIETARQLGISVPDQLSVVGFDDVPAASLITPPLTTIRQPLLEIGALAARLLVALVEGKPAPLEMHLLEPSLVVRGTTAPPARHPQG